MLQTPRGGTVERLFRTVKARLQPGSYEAGQLQAVEDKPGSLARQQSLVGAAAEYLAEHPELAGELEQLVSRAQQAGARVLAISSGITASNVNIRAGGNVVGRDVIADATRVAWDPDLQ